MQAVTYTTLGPAREVLRLEQHMAPTPAPGEVLVRVAFSGVNPSDVKARGGARPGMTTPPWPLIIPHSDGSGVIEAVGDGVNPSRIGERVWIWNAQWRRPFGTAATYVALDQAQAVPLPDDVSLEVGATLGIPALTAAHCVFGSGEVTGQTLLIAGGSGTVGMQAVQLAKWGGARVIATCSDAARDRVLAAGADVALCYDAPDLAAQVLAANGGNPIDRAVEVELGANITLLTEVMAENSTIAAYGSALRREFELPFYTLMFKAITLETVLIYLLPLAKRVQAIVHIHKALDEGGLRPEIQQVYDPEDCIAAHEAVEAGHRQGAILLGF